MKIIFYSDSEKRKDVVPYIMIKRNFYVTLFIAILYFVNANLNVLAAYPENTGIITSDTQLYTAASRDAACIGSIKKGNRVDIVSALSCYILIRHDNLYAYVPASSICFVLNHDYREKMLPYTSPYKFLVTEGNLYEKAADTLMQAYFAIPEKIRNVFEQKGFLIKITEWDITEEAYAPYGGYNGTGTIKAVLDYEQKKLYVNDEFPTAIIHEIGHFVNNYLHISSRPENQQLFYTEASKISSYAETNDREFFAEAFRLYISVPQILALVSPDSYDMVNTAIRQFP